MKHVVVKFSELTDGKCLSPKRFTGECPRCKYVMRCKLPQGHIGRMKLLVGRLERRRKEVITLEQKVVAATMEAVAKGHLDPNEADEILKQVKED